MPIEQIFSPRPSDIGGMTVRRLLPKAARQAVGPFLFFDHMGPLSHVPGEDHDVPPHPHIGLATVTYLFDGALLHRDSLGTVQRIEPGAINWMTAGRGIAHSERIPDDLKGRPHTLHGLQLWAALPRALEEALPSFTHTPASAMPQWRDGALGVRVLIGKALGLRSPVATFAETLYLDVVASAAATFELDAETAERAVYAVDAPLEIDGEWLAPGQLAVLAEGLVAQVSARAAARYVVIGGAPLDGRRFMWWNYVASSKERIEAAKDEWRRMGPGVVPGDPGYLPLPER